MITATKSKETKWKDTLPALLLKVRKQGGKNVFASIGQSIYLMLSYTIIAVYNTNLSKVYSILSLLWEENKCEPICETRHNGEY